MVNYADVEWSKTNGESVTWLAGLIYSADTGHKIAELDFTATAGATGGMCLCVNRDGSYELITPKEFACQQIRSQPYF